MDNFLSGNFRTHILILYQNIYDDLHSTPSSPSSPKIDDTSNDATAGNNNKKKKKREWIKPCRYRRMMKKKKKEKVSVIFNYSGIKLSDGAEKLLNRGLNFSILPDQLNFTKVLVDVAELQRKMEWKEYFHDKEEQKYDPPLFKKKKYTFPPITHPRPKELSTFINAIRSELSDEKNCTDLIFLLMKLLD